MKEIVITENQAGQRLDKFLTKYLSQAPKGFLYKMLRKKNITLNGKKADGHERLNQKDTVTFFLSEETFEKFKTSVNIPKFASPHIPKLDIIFENKHICLINKPWNLLSQKSKPQDLSVNELFLQYMKDSGQLNRTELGFCPAICNRLDRNTTGILIGGKTLYGLQCMSELLKKRSIHKYYLCIVAGMMRGSAELEGFLSKNPNTNQVVVLSKPNNQKGNSWIKTAYRTLTANELCSLLEVHLITGRTHQIRAHLATIGHPIIGDRKYGDLKINNIMRNRYQLKHQLLHSWRLEFPVLDGELSDLSGRTFTAPPLESFSKIIKGEHLSYGNMEF